MDIHIYFEKKIANTIRIKVTNKVLCKRGNRGENKVEAAAAAVATATATAAAEPALKHTPIACKSENERCGWYSTTENRSSSGSIEVVAIEIAPIIPKQNDCIIKNYREKNETHIVEFEKRRRIRKQQKQHIRCEFVFFI